MAYEKPKIKLLTFWKRDREYEKTVCNHFISHGIWQTVEVEFNEIHGRIYTLRCVMPMHKDLHLNKEIRMWEDVILSICHPVAIIDLPKIT